MIYRRPQGVGKTNRKRTSDSFGNETEGKVGKNKYVI